MSNKTDNRSSEITKASTVVQPKRVVDSRIKKTILLILLVLCAFFTFFPNAGLGPVLGSVANDLHDSKNMSWYMTVFALSSTISQLLGVRISDCLGRRRTLLTLTYLGFITTLICGFSINNEMFIACRLIQGCSMGSIYAVIPAALVDLFDIKDRLKYQPLINTALGSCFIIGPILGSVFVDHLSWRFIFWATAIFFVPISIGFYYLIDIPLQPDQSLSKENLRTLMGRIDPIGCILITIGMSLFLLGMHFGGTSINYTWTSPLVIGFLAGFVLLFILFLAFEKFVTSRPLFPSPVVLDIHLILCYIQQFIIGWQYILFDVLIFIQYQAVDNMTPTEASIKLLPASILHVVFIIVGGKVSYRFENPKIVVVIGNVFCVVAVVLIQFVQKMDSSTAVQGTLIAIYQIGVAMCCTASTLCIQMILEKKAPHLVAISNSLGQCFNRCGSTIGTAFVLSLLQSQTTGALRVLQSTQPDMYEAILTYDVAHNYVKVRDIPSTSVQHTLNVMYYENIMKIVYGFTVCSIISLLAAVFAKVPSIPKKPLEVELEKNEYYCATE